MKRRSIVLVAAASMAVLTLGSALTAHAEDKPVKIGYYGIPTTEAFFKGVYDGLVEAVDARGWEMIVDFTYYDPVKMRSAYDNFKSQGVDFIIDANGIEDVIVPFAEEAAKDGIPYLALHVELEDPAYTWGSKDQDMGAATGRYLGQKVLDEWDGHVDCIAEFGSFVLSPVQAIRVSQPPVTMEEEFGIDLSNTEIIEVDSETANSQKAYQDMMDILTAHPDQKILCFVHTDDLANTVYSAIQAAGRNDDCMITGSDCVDVAVEHFKECADSENLTDAWRGSIYLGPETYGEPLCEIIEKVLSGEEVPYDNYVDPKVCGIDNVYEFFPEE